MDRFIIVRDVTIPLSDQEYQSIEKILLPTDKDNTFRLDKSIEAIFFPIKG